MESAWGVPTRVSAPGVPVRVAISEGGGRVVMRVASINVKPRDATEMDFNGNHHMNLP